MLINIKKNLIPLFSSWIFLIGIIIESITALISSSIPMFNLMDYESTLTMALVHSFVSLLISVNFTRIGIKTGEKAYNLWVKSLLLSILVLLIPFIIMIFSGIIHEQCSYLTGLKFFIFYPVISGFISTSIGFSLGRIIQKWWIIIVALLVPVFSILFEVWHFYYYPPIFSYDPFFGYFSGAFYDSLVEINPPFLFARAYHLAIAASLVLSVMIIKKDLLEKRYKYLAVFSICYSLVSGFLSPVEGFRYNRNDMKSYLGGNFSTDHYNIWYSKSIPLREVKLIAAQSEFYYKVQKDFFKGSPSGKIGIWFFKDSLEKRKIFGAQNVEVAKPWLKEIYITRGSFPHHSLKHELGHIFAGIYGDPWFKVSMSYSPVFPGISVPMPNPGLIEGVAVASSFVSDGITYHQRAKILYNLGFGVPLRYLLSSKFYTLSSQRAYTEAGSFIKFLYDTYGADKTFKIYESGGNYKKITGKSLNELDLEYQEFLKSIQVDEKTIAFAKVRFARRPIHKRRCVHEVARELSKTTFFLKKKKYERALTTIKKAVNYDPESIDLKLFYIDIARKAKQIGEARNIALEVISKTKNSIQKARAKLILVEIAWLKGDLENAKSTLMEIWSSPLSRSMEREVKFIEEIFALPVKPRKIMKDIFLNPMPQKIFIDKILKLKDIFPLSPYIAGTLLLSSGKWEDSTLMFNLVKVNKLPLNNFKCEYYRRALIANFLSQKFIKASKFAKAGENCSQVKLISKFFVNFMEFLNQNPKFKNWKTE